MAAAALTQHTPTTPTTTTISQNGFTKTSHQMILTTTQVAGHDVLRLPRDGFSALIRSLSEKQEAAVEPFYILDLGVLERLMDKWNQSLPNVHPFYAVKCNPEPVLLAALSALGANFDCASKAEIQAVIDRGVSPERIVYANPCKSEAHIKYAASVGVNLTTFDTKVEVDKMKKCHPKCNLLLRIKVLNDDKTSWRALGSKFGALSDEIVPLLRYAKEAGMNVSGVSFHVGSIASEPRQYRRAIAAARAVFDAAADLNMPKMHIMNIGGGFKDNPLFVEIGEAINEAIQDYFPTETQDNSLVAIAEPGRFFPETSFTLVSKVFGKRVRGDRREYWINDGMYGSINLPVYDRANMLLKPLPKNADQFSDTTCYPSTLFGPTCDSHDIVVQDCKLPELQLGDLVVFYNMGAYTASAGTKFNGFDIADLPTFLAYTS